MVVKPVAGGVDLLSRQETVADAAEPNSLGCWVVPKADPSTGPGGVLMRGHWSAA